MRDKSKPKSQDYHKEESKGRVQSDELDRVGLLKTLQKCIDPFKKDLKGLVNVYSGFIAISDVNVHDSVKVGEDEQKKFFKNLPEDFHKTISTKITTMKSAMKSFKSGEIEIFNTEVIYFCVMCLLSIDRIKLEDVLRFELSPIPLSL